MPICAGTQLYRQTEPVLRPLLLGGSSLDWWRLAVKFAGEMLKEFDKQKTVLVITLYTTQLITKEMQ